MMISQLNKVIEEMRSVYPFKDDESHIRFIEDSRYSNRELIVTTYSEDGTKIVLSKVFKTTPTSAEKRSL